MTAPIAIRRPERPAIRSQDLSLVVKPVVNETSCDEYWRSLPAFAGRPAEPQWPY
jgi:hypothetical protein